MKNKKVRVPLKRKVLIISLLILIIMGITLAVFVHNKNKSTIADIKKHYSNNVIVIKNSKLYDKNEKEIGKVNKDVILKLEKEKINSVKDKYLKISNSNYYIYYKDIKKSKESGEVLSPNILVFNQSVKTDKKTSLYKLDNEVATINKGVKLPIQKIDDNFYYVSFLGNIYGIKKDACKVVDSNNTSEAEAEFISVMHYEKIEKECGETLCANETSVKEQLNYLKEAGYHTITINDYIDFLNDKVRLKNKAILLTTSNNNDILQSLNKENKLNIEVLGDNGIKFDNSNNKTTKESTVNNASRYLIKNITTLDNYKKMVGGENIVEKVYRPGDTKKEQSIAVLNYHFFYDPNQGESCNETICLTTDKFRQHLEYLKNNGYKTLKMEEFKQWMYGEIELPEKSVLLTIDDGAMGTGAHNGNKLIPLLEEYNMNATLFLISGWWDVNNYRSPNLDVQSHTYDMHQHGPCGSGQVVCATPEQLREDLDKSLQIVDNNNSFCFPFYAYDNKSLKVVEEAGFKMSFVGGNVKANRTNNKYLIPRYVILSDITMNQFINMIS